MTNEEKVKQFTMIVVPTVHDDWMAFYHELQRSSIAYGPTPELAVQELHNMTTELCEAAEEFGVDFPEPAHPYKEYY